MTLAPRLRTRTRAVQDIHALLSRQHKPTMASVIKAADYVPEQRIVVYKAANGQARWFSRASSAFEEKDREIVTKAALKGAAQKIMDGPGVPLRLWHIGTKGETPIDIGWCDLAFLCGETLYAGGTVKSGCEPLVETNPEQSIGYLPPDGVLLPAFRVLDNNGMGIYDSIDINEISVCPIGKARNYFTGVTLHDS